MTYDAWIPELVQRTEGRMTSDFMAQLMGDPPHRRDAIADVLEERQQAADARLAFEPPEARKSRVLAMWDAELSIGQITDATGLSISTVYRYIRERSTE